jgi:NitT/TauT family transport system substrate-binding protein
MVAGAAMLGAGCSSAGGSAASGVPAGPPEKPDITVAAVPTLDETGLYIAQQRGIFARYGLHVKIVPIVSSADVISEQIAGKVDISAGNYVSYILASQHTPLKILAAGSVMGPNIQMLLVAAHSPIATVAQLQNKKIAINAPQNIGTLLVDSIFNNDALPLGSITFAYMPFQQMAKALQTGKVAAAWMPEPFVTEAEETVGAQPLADADAGTTQNLPIAGYVATAAWVKKYPRTAAAFKAAILEGQQIAGNDMAAAQQAIIKYAFVPAQTAPIVAAPSYPLRLDPVSIQRVANLMLQFGIVSHGVSTAQMTSSSG